jgi:hypothetical protein
LVGLPEKQTSARKSLAAFHRFTVVR